ncbi:transposase [Methanobrevibacter arboriphilus]|uniref:transposase n=1 Tax=Methanobrevibacter arboriphilus TaxID=39441 RepID=UPI001CDB237D
MHSGSPNDSKLFDEILKELKIRRIMRNNKILIFDKGYYGYKYYIIGICKYKIIPFIFPKK